MRKDVFKIAVFNQNNIGANKSEHAHKQQCCSKNMKPKEKRFWVSFSNYVGLNKESDYLVPFKQMLT